MGAGAPPPAFELSTGPPPTVAATTRSTWLHPARIISDAAETSPLAAPRVTLASTPPSTTTTAPSVGATGQRPSLTTTTTRPPATTTTLGVIINVPVDLSPVIPALRSPATQTERGQASWFNTADRTCAHRTAPVGTVIKVTRPSTGGSTTCEVTGWGPADTSRVIDLSMDTFELLAHAGTGLIDVVIEW